MKKSVIVSACRTPVGAFMGGLSVLRSPDLGGIVIAEAIKRARLKVDQIDEVIMGCVLTAGLGQAPARQAALAAGLPNNVGAFTVDKVCSSGLKSIMLADQIIRAGDADCVIAGGMESMSQAPHLLPHSRLGHKMGNVELVDSMVFDGLWDIYTNQHMGDCAELCADKFHFTREEQDRFAIESYERALKAHEAGKFKDEIVTVSIPQRKGEPVVIDHDEELARVRFDKIPQLRPVFKKGGTVTAANASSINDGAAAVVVMSEEKAQALKLTPLATISAHGAAAKEPEWYTTAPIDAIRNVLAKLNLTVDEIDLFEINEAFAAVSLAAQRELQLDPAKVNVNGGAIAIGHPIGASGTRILTTLLYEMKRQNQKKSLISLCNGGGEATAMILER